MQIDWVTTVAQIVNFLVLVFLLERFLYRPVIAAMDRRQQRVTDRLAEARKREDEAQAQAREYRRRQEELERRRKELLAEARTTADAERERLTAEARAQVERMRDRWRQDLERERRDFLARLMEQAGRSVMRVAQRALHDLADRELEQQTIAVFLGRFAALDEAQRAALTEARGPLVVSTSFEADARRRSALAEALREQLGEATEIRFERSPDLVCGIEVRRGSMKVDWTIAQYLEGLETRFKELLASPPGEMGQAAS